MNTVWEVIEVIHVNMPEIDLDKIVLGGRIVMILCAAIILRSVRR